MLPEAAPTMHVLPTGVRRRPGRRDALLALVLTGELLAGMGLRVLWEHREELSEALLPQAATVSSESTVSTSSAVTTTTWIVVPPAPIPTDPPPPPPAPRTTGRNPFVTQAG